MIKTCSVIFLYVSILLLSVITQSHAGSVPSFAFLKSSSLFKQDKNDVYACSATPAKIYRNNEFSFPSTLLLTKESYNTCQITAYTALQQLKLTSVFLIDTRSSSEYAQLSIPGSLNIPQYAIKTKAFLKNKKLILINQGDKSLMLNKTCRTLKTLGFDVHVVSGGLNSWSMISYFSENNPVAFKQLNQITAQTLYSELVLPDILLISLQEPDSNSDTMLDINKTIHSITSSTNINLIATQLNHLIKQHPQARRLVIYTEDGHIPAHIKNNLKNYSEHSVFYLSGGKSTFQQYRKEQAALQKRRHYPSNQLYRCQG